MHTLLFSSEALCPTAKIDLFEWEVKQTEALVIIVNLI